MLAIDNLENKLDVLSGKQNSFEHETMLRFEKIDNLLEKAQIDKLEERFNNIDKKFDDIDKKFDNVDKNFFSMQNAIDTLALKLTVRLGGIVVAGIAILAALIKI